MVHALERARQLLVSDGVVVLIQPHQLKRPFIAITAPGKRRQPVAALISPPFQPRINAAVAAIQTVVERGLFVRIGIGHHQFRSHLVSPAELRRYLHLDQQPARFPAGGKQRLRDLWKSRPAGARIEVTESLTVMGLRVE
jgi:hypothetical protein